MCCLGLGMSPWWRVLAGLAAWLAPAAVVGPDAWLGALAWRRIPPGPAGRTARAVAPRWAAAARRHLSAGAGHLAVYLRGDTGLLAGVITAARHERTT